MKQLEDRIKDRLEGYESSLPEGDLAEFKALLDSVSSAPSQRKSLYLAWLAPTAVAAGLALFFVFGHGPQADTIHVIDKSELVADVIEPETPEITEEEHVNLPETMHARKSHGATTPMISANTETECEATEPDVAAKDPVTEPTKEEGKASENHQSSVMERDNGSASPFAPAVNVINRKPVSVKVGQATAGVLGGTGAVALAGVLPTLLANNDIVNTDGTQSSEVVNPGGTISGPEGPIDGRTRKDSHYMPLRAGLSLRIPFNDRWSVTTGLDYSWYASSIEYSLSGAHKQNVHYLGIPVLADFTIARNRWMDVYVGAGASADFCVAAFDAGKKVAGDGVGFSLIGAGGVQLNISKHLGLFLDPTFSWNIPTEGRRLDTYKSEFPFMFTVSTGLRVTLKGKE